MVYVLGFLQKLRIQTDRMLAGDTAELSAQHPKPWDESSILPSPKHSELEA